MRPTRRIHRTARSAFLVAILVLFGMWFVLAGEAHAQDYYGDITLIKEAEPADGTDFSLELLLIDGETSEQLTMAPLNIFVGPIDIGGVSYNPTSVAVGPGPGGVPIVYVADFDNHRIHLFDSEGYFLRAFGWNVYGGGSFETCPYDCQAGESGGAAGQFHEPFGVAVGPDGSLYVAESGNQRIQQFDVDGNFVRMWGRGVLTGGDDFEICDDPTLCQAGSDGGGAGQFNVPRGVAVAPDGSIIVADSDNHRIQQFNADGTFRRMWGWDVIDNGETGFEICEASDPCKSGDFGDAAGGFNYPLGVVVGPATGTSYSIYIADTYNHRIQEFDANGNFVRAWGWGVRDGADAFQICTSSCQAGEIGGAAGQFNTPTGMAVGRAGSIYVADSYNHRIQQFDADANFVRTWGWNVLPDGSEGFEICEAPGPCAAGEAGDNEGQFDFPVAVATGSNGLLYVVDLSNSRVYRFLGDGIIVDDAEIDDGDAYGNTVVLEVLPADKIYVFSETVPSLLWALEEVICDAEEWGHEDNLFYVWLKDGEKVTCTLYNAKTSTLTLVKDAEPADGTDFVIETPLEPRGSFGYEVTGLSPATLPGGIAEGLDGSIYVADTNKHRIRQFDAFGNLIRMWGWGVAGGTGFETCTAPAPCKEGIPGDGAGQFGAPNDVAVGPDGSVYVADTGNHRIQVFDAVGSFVRAWGSNGGDAGEFDAPIGVAVAPDGAVYVADAGNHRIQQFTSDGTFVRAWGGNVISDDGVTGFEICEEADSCQAGEQGSTEGYFDTPTGVAVWPGPGGRPMVYVADTGNHRIQQFDAEGNFIRTWGDFGEERSLFDTPTRVATGPGPGGLFMVYVADTGNHRIQQFDAEGNFVRTWGWGVYDDPFAFEVCEMPDLCRAGTPGSRLGQFDSPYGIVVGSSGWIYVTEMGNQRVQKFLGANIVVDDAAIDDGDAYSDTVVIEGLAAGEYWFVEALPSELWSLENVSCTGGVPFHEDNEFGVILGGNTHVTCTLTNRGPATLTLVKEAVPADGTNFVIETPLVPLGAFGSAGNGAGQIDDPTGVAVGPDGTIYVADQENHRIQAFDALGNFVRTWGWGVLTGGDTFEVCEAPGPCLKGREGPGAGQFEYPDDVTVGPDGSVYVTEFTHHRIQKFDAAGNFVRMWGRGVATGGDDFETCDAPGPCFSGNEGDGAGHFRFPTSAAVGPDGSVYVADEGNSRIQQFTSDGDFVRMWGWNVDPDGDAGFEICEDPGPCQGGIGGEGAGQFNSPTDIAIGPDGWIYVADRGNERIQQFTKTGHFVRAWGRGVITGGPDYENCEVPGPCVSGSEGDGAGEFDTPVGVAVGPDGSVYVTEIDNYRIQQFTSDGFFVRMWGRGVLTGGAEFEVCDDPTLCQAGDPGDGEGEFDEPSSIAVGPNGMIYVADYNNQRVHRFLGASIVLDDAEIDDGDAYGDTVVIEGLAPGEYSFVEALPPAPWTLESVGCTGDEQEHVGNSFTVALSSGAHMTCTLTNLGPATLTLVKEALPADGMDFVIETPLLPLGRLGSNGSGAGQYFEIGGVAVGPDGSVYISERGNGRIQVFDAAGNFVRMWGWGVLTGGDTFEICEAPGPCLKGREGGGAGQFVFLDTLVVGPNGSVYVVDRDNYRIQQFDAGGNFVRMWGRGVNGGTGFEICDDPTLCQEGISGSGAGEFDDPEGLAVGLDGSVYVVDHDNDRIQQFTPDGTFVRMWGRGVNGGVGFEICVDPTLCQSGSDGDGAGEFDDAEHVAVGPDGSVYVVDSSNHRIQQFTPDGTFVRAWGWGVDPNKPGSGFEICSAPPCQAGSDGDGAGQFDDTEHVAVGPDGSVYVVDSGNDRIQQFTPDGHFVRMWGRGVLTGGAEFEVCDDPTLCQAGDPGDGEGEFDEPSSIAVGPNGMIYVADTGRVQKFFGAGIVVDDAAIDDGDAYGDTVVIEGLATRAHTFTEIMPSKLWTLENVTCLGDELDLEGNSFTVALSSGAHMTCTLTNRGPATLTLVKEAVPADGTDFVIETPVRLLGAFGHDGYSAHPLDDPTGVAVGPDGSVYVVDLGHHRIQQFDAAGNFVRMWGWGVATGADQFEICEAPGTCHGGSDGDGTGQLSYPTGIAVGPDGSVYVADTGNHRIQVFDAVGTYMNTWGSNGNGAVEFSTPMGVAVAPDGSVYVADRSNHRVQKFTSDGIFERTWGWGVVTGAGQFQICDDPSLCREGNPGSAAGQFDDPHGVAVGPDGSVYVADYDNHRIQQFLPDGTFVRAWGWDVDPNTVETGFEICSAPPCKAGSSGSGAGQFDGPAGVAVEPDGSVYVADNGNARVQQFTSTGNFVRMWGWGVATGADQFETCVAPGPCREGNPGSEMGQFNGPNGLAVGPDGLIYVSEGTNERVQQFLSASVVLDDAENDDGDGYSDTVVIDTLAEGSQIFLEWVPSPVWTLTEVSCTDGLEAHDGSAFTVALSAGGHVTCTLTNLSQSLTVEKVVVGGPVSQPPLTADDFPLFVSAIFPVTIDTIPVTRGIPTLLESGEYVVSEAGNPDYALTFGGDCNDTGRVTLEIGQHRTCILTNTYITQTITVVKIVAGGGPLTEDDFPLFVDGNLVTRGVPTLVDRGLHTVTETSDPRYVATIGGDCDANGNVMIGDIAHATCILTNTYITQTLTVEKVVVGDGPLGADDFALFVNDVPVTRGVPTVVESGLLTVTEASDPRYAATFGGACDANGNVTLGIGEHLTCTITNTLLTGDLVIVKDTVPDDAAANWFFDVSGPTAFQQAIRGDDRVTTTVAVGSYTIVESAGAATNLDEYTTSYACVTVGGGEGPSGSGATAADVIVGAGETVVCTFTNERLPASLEVSKTVGTDPNLCATTSVISVTASSMVYFCITIENTGELPLVTHLVEDPLLGISESIEQELAPDETLVLTHNEIEALAVLATGDITNTVTVTSRTAEQAGEPSAEAEPVTATSQGVAVVEVTTPTADDPTDEPDLPHRLHLPIIGR